MVDMMADKKDVMMADKKVGKKVAWMVALMAALMVY